MNQLQLLTVKHKTLVFTAYLTKSIKLYEFVQFEEILQMLNLIYTGNDENGDLWIKIAKMYN
jgi:hypothetical protein